ncbi:hypothetical protein Acr_12g0004060 [Actinidia rufa]|uniref:Uncharacterized protein n=1 Tax=Actinidia rufa TaxID=165716 RepID=A0A7J0FGQ0_9ERIC|nr:hypothetical protein Acr_12g0004060 [Actinidia rufa]
MKAVTSHVTQSISISTEISKNAPKWTMVPNASGPSSMAAIVSQTPDLVERPPLTNRMPSYPIPPDQVYLQSMPPLRNLGLELGRRRIQAYLHFKPPEGPSSTPCNLSLSNNGENEHLNKTRGRVELELGSGRIQDNMGNYADCLQLKHCLLQPEISPRQNQTRENSMHFVPAATTNQMVPARTFPYGALSVPDSLGKPPGIAMHTAQSDSLKVTLEVPHSIDSKWIDDKQRTKQFISSPMSLKERDESSQRDYIQMLLHLLPAELSRHAVELEKKAVQLTREEGLLNLTKRSEVKKFEPCYERQGFCHTRHGPYQVKTGS